MAMKIIVVFDYPDINDINGPIADQEIDSLTIDLKRLENTVGYNWYIDDVVESTE
jgi:hypothetical protein